MTSPSGRQLITLRVDGEEVEVTVRPHHFLVDVLRQQVGRIGVKEGCESASCGACTVLLDGVPVLSCLLLAMDAVGREITTVAGLGRPPDGLHPLQEAFIKHHAVQCGFCTPGILLVARALLEENASPTEEEVRQALAGNLCRCTGYVRIVRAVLEAAALQRR
ncbi:Carbon monoxide dehydrogenase small chain [bacterium HR25]|jgi:carbon-monoxide dehydrogenase small subunit|nr:Carbon monoxide dehydrogenase small chain [bacterium HR25]